MAIAHFTLATRDVERSRRFFEQVFGWEPIHRPDNIDRQAAWLRITPEQQVHLVHVEDFEASPFDQEFGRHIALFHRASDLPALKERLTAAGAELIAAQRPTPFERFFFRDPNGYVFEIIDQDHFVPE